MAYQLLKKQAAPVSAPPQAAHHAASQPGGVSLAGEGVGAQRIEQVLSGQGTEEDQAQFNSLMEILNGAANSGELSPENLAMLYNAGGKSREFVVNRTQDNMVRHIQQQFLKDHPGGYNKTGQEHGDYMATLQNSAVRQGNGGVIAEYGNLMQLLSKRAGASVIDQSLGEEPEELRDLPKNDERFKAAAQAGAPQITARMTEAISGAEDFQNYNSQFMEKLRATMPEAFSDEEVSRSFVGKSALLRGLFPSVTNGDDRARDDRFITYRSQAAIGDLNREMLNLGTGISGMTPETKRLRDAMVPGFRQTGTVAPVENRPAPVPLPLRRRNG